MTPTDDARRHHERVLAEHREHELRTAAELLGIPPERLLADDHELRRLRQEADPHGSRAHPD